MSKGLLIKGKLVGVKDSVNRNKKTGEEFPYKALGIEIPFINSFGVSAPLTKEVRIGREKQHDASFMNALNEYHNKDVEIEIGVGDFKTLFVAKSAVVALLVDRS